MTLDYRKTFEIEIINEFQSAIHSKMLNYVLNNELDKSDSTNLQTNLLNQLSNMNQINLFKSSLEELEAYHDYLRSIKKYADSITRTTWVLTNTLDDKTKCKLSFIAQLRRNEVTAYKCALKNKGCVSTKLIWKIFP